MIDDPGSYFMDDKVPDPPSEPEPAPVEEPAQRARKERGNGASATKSIIQADDVVLPANIDAEKTILGAVMLDDKAIPEIAKIVEADDFSLDSHRRIWLRMSELYEAKITVDIITLMNRLSMFKELEAIGGATYLASLTEGLPRRPVIDNYIRIVKDKSLLRRMMLLSTAALTQCSDQSTDALTILSQYEYNLNNVKESARSLMRGDPSSPFFVGYRTFVSEAPEEIDWTIDGVVQAEGNGLIVGDSGASKSLMAYDLTLHLVAGAPWFQHAIKRRRKVGLVSREDATGLCQSRMQRLIYGAGETLRMCLDCVDLEEWLYFNTRAQRDTWTLQSEADIQDIIAAIQERGIEFIVIDVFREVWQGNENDNQETAKVLAAAKRIGREGKCQVALIHHLSKSEKGTVFDRARGGGINGWKEWGIGVTVENPDADPKSHIRKLHFHTKADCSAPHVFYRISGDESSVRLDHIDDYQAPAYTPSKSKKKKGQDQSQMNYGEE